VTNYTAQFTDNDIALFKRKMLYWINRYSIFCVLNSNNYSNEDTVYDCICAAGAKEIFCPQQNYLQHVDAFVSQPGWTFGHFNYDIKNEIEPLHSSHPNNIGFAEMFLFHPQIIIIIQKNNITIHADESTGKNLYSHKKLYLRSSSYRNKNFYSTTHQQRKLYSHHSCAATAYCSRRFL